MSHDVWAAGEAYEAYVGRWSRQIAPVFVEGLGVPAGRSWLDVGCGTGALTQTILSNAEPSRVVGVDPAEGFLTTARAHTSSDRAVFQLGDARELPFGDGEFDAVVSALAINFVPQPQRAVSEMARVTAPGGVTAAYVWDYAEGMQFMRYFWDAAVTLDSAAAQLDEGRRFPLCEPDPLRTLWAQAGLTGITVEAIDLPTVFPSFDDFWQPFLGGQGPAPGYLMSLPEAHRITLRDLLRSRLPGGDGGPVELTARAWAVRGVAAAGS